MTEKRRQHVFITDREHGLPYSKGLLASSLMVTGLGPAKSYRVANRVEEELHSQGDSVTPDELRDLTIRCLREEAGDRYAEAFIKWQSVAELNIPLIILIGGATGAGKSTIATQLATRLGITRVVSTDAVREVLRSAFTAEMFPTLYASSFEADKAVRQPIPHSGDRLIIGFREQAAAVAVGAQALIDRAIAEGTDMILEGAHLVPGFLESVDTDEAVIVPLLVTVEDEELHRSHFYRRGRDTGRRDGDRYLNAFKKIRKIQKYMTSSALMRGVPVIEHVDLDNSLSEIIDHVIARALEAVERGASVGGGREEELLGQAVEAIGRERMTANGKQGKDQKKDKDEKEGSITSEVVS
jgi:2-phosphoglycerate kinase